MTADTLRRRVDALEADAATADTWPAVVIYLPTDTEEEKLARAPAGAEITIFLPWNERDPDLHPGPAPAPDR